MVDTVCHYHANTCVLRVDDAGAEADECISLVSVRSLLQFQHDTDIYNAQVTYICVVIV